MGTRKVDNLPDRDFVFVVGEEDGGGSLGVLDKALSLLGKIVLAYSNFSYCRLAENEYTYSPIPLMSFTTEIFLGIDDEPFPTSQILFE